MAGRPATVVEHALRAYDKGRAACVPGPLNTATAAFTAVTPQRRDPQDRRVVVSRPSS